MFKLVLGIDQHNKLRAIDANRACHHTLVVGQSGSGKSTFLTRLIEELVSRTGGRVLILDPNGDYSCIHQIHQPEAAELKRSTDLDALVKSYGLPQLDNLESFKKRWDEINIQYVGYCKFDNEAKAHTRRQEACLYVAWCYMDPHDKAALLAVDAATQPDLYTAFKILDNYLYDFTDNHLKTEVDDHLGVRDEKRPDGIQPYDLGTVSRIATKLAENTRCRVQMQPVFSDVNEETWRHVSALAGQIGRRFNVWQPRIGDSQTPAVQVMVENGVEGKSRKDNSVGCWSVCVVGMPPIQTQQDGVKTQDDALLVADSVLSKVWKAALVQWDKAARSGKDDMRVPLFIVLDEAQLFAPRVATPGLQQRVCDKIIRIAAEGRKYGLHLILSTQRPSKLNEGLIYECENQAIFCLQSPAELELATSAFHLLDSMKVRDFKVGECFMRGKWDEHQTCIRSGSRRTVAGGRNLDQSYWLDEKRYGKHESRQSLMPGLAGRLAFNEESDDELLAYVTLDASVISLITLNNEMIDNQRWHIARATAEHLLHRKDNNNKRETAKKLARILKSQRQLAEENQDEITAINTRIAELVKQFPDLRV